LKSIVFHPYKGGTGKTTLAANCAALLAKRGYLLDFNAYAPSLHLYFGVEPKKWINEFLSAKAELKEVTMDFNPIIKNRIYNKDSKTKYGQLLAGFRNPEKEEVYKLEIVLGKKR
jgi:chromosome partitioning protein